jgi:hypothetical protein
MVMLLSKNHINVAPADTPLANCEAGGNLSKTSEQLLSRKALAKRWECSLETIKRRTRKGLLHPVRFSQRMIRYPISEIIRVEQEGSEITP